MVVVAWAVYYCDESQGDKLITELNQNVHKKFVICPTRKANGKNSFENQSLTWQAQA